MSDTPLLAGIRVVDFGQFIAGPAVGQILADFGASVVKVEPLAGETSRTAGAYGAAMVRTFNRDKQGLSLDLRQPEALEVAERLVGSSDVLVQNMRPRVMEKLGLGPDRACELNPRLIYLSITAFGKDAPSSRPGLDIAAQAESGMMSVTGEASQEPQRIGFTVADATTGYAGANAVLAALVRRERTGAGAVIDTSLLQTAVHVQGANWVNWFTTGVEPTRKGNGQPTSAPAAEVLQVRDGQIVLSAYTPAHWLRLCTALSQPGIATDPRFATNGDRLVHRQELRDVLSAALSDLTVDEAVNLLARNGIVAGAVRTYSQVLESEDARRLDLFPATEHGGMGSYRHAAPPYTIRGLDRRTTRSAPAVGEHSRSVLAQLGYAAAEVDQLVNAGVVGDGSQLDAHHSDLEVNSGGPAAASLTSHDGAWSGV